jgi:hypothetical protein
MISLRHRLLLDSDGEANRGEALLREGGFGFGATCRAVAFTRRRVPLEIARSSLPGDSLIKYIGLAV